MYAVVNTGGKQYKVREGEVHRFEKIPGDVGAPVSFDRVLMFSDGEDVKIGQPMLADVAVSGRIVEQDKSKKVLVFKYKRRKRYRRKQGHRQPYTAVRIERIGDPAALAAEPEPVPAEAVSSEPVPSEALYSEPVPSEALYSEPVPSEALPPEPAPEAVETKETTAPGADK